MRKIISHAHISLDGYAAGPNGEMDWIKLSDDMFDFVNTITQSADTALYGRKTWQMMDAYWPTAAKQPGASKHDKEHSQWYNTVEKIVITKTLVGEAKDKTRFVGADFADFINRFKKSEGGNILLLGSPSVIRLFTEHSLIDEYWFFINPVILGGGLSVFSESKKRIALKTDKFVNFDCGVVALRYQLNP